MNTAKLREETTIVTPPVRPAPPVRTRGAGRPASAAGTARPGGTGALALAAGFRYLRGVPRSAAAAVASAVLPALLVVVMSSGCTPKAKTPDEAYRWLSKAVQAQDPGALFDALDQTTRWDWMTIQKWHREAYDVVISNFPEGPARERELHRFEKGATAASAKELFASEVGASVLPQLAPLVVADPKIELEGDVAEVVLSGGGRVRLLRGTKGGWGFAGLMPDAEERKARAYHDLDMVRVSAADYERAAARGAK
jgi:hypothetical protein